MIELKSTSTAYLLGALCLVGVAGINRFYLGKPWTGILFFFTWGLFGFGLIYDVITTQSQVDSINYNR
jgi:TM2 domain-containing membrane protein YozV